MRWIVGSSLRFLVIPVAAGLLLLGIFQLRSAPVDVLPEFTPPLVDIQTEAPGLSAEEVEQLVTVPLEQDLLNGVAWLEQIRSQSLPGLSRIELIFRPGTDLLQARQLVQERLVQAPGGIPNVAKAPVMLQSLSSTSRVMMIGLSSGRVPDGERITWLTSWVMDEPALSPFIRSFERHLRSENRSERTIATYLVGLRQADAFLRARGTTLQVATRADLEAFMGDLLAHRAASTAATYYKMLKLLYAWLAEEEEIPTNPMARMAGPGRSALLCLDGDPWLDDDAILSVKPDLIVALERHERPEELRARGVDRPLSTASYDFTLELAG